MTTVPIMTNNEISRRLALAIGWESWQVGDDDASGAVWICTEPESTTGPARFMVFDYRDPAVIWPIAEGFIFPVPCNGQWRCRINDAESVIADTAAKAVALAVINAKESKS